MKDFIVNNKYWFIGLGGIALLGFLMPKGQTTTTTEPENNPNDLPYLNLVPQTQRAQFAQKVKDFCNPKGIKPAWLMCLMHLETAGTLSPSKWNNIGCIGLIQFCPTTGARTVGKSTIELSKMTHTQQLDYVFKFLNAMIGSKKITNFVDLYILVLYPAYFYKSLDDKFPSAIAYSNPVFIKNGIMSKRTIQEVFIKRYGRYVQ